jgi:transposase-like protein
MIHPSLALFSTCCPYCKSIDFRSVGIRSRFEKIFQRLLQPYRCALCGHHFCLFRRAVAVGDTT